MLTLYSKVSVVRSYRKSTSTDNKEFWQKKFRDYKHIEKSQQQVEQSLIKLFFFYMYPSWINFAKIQRYGKLTCFIFFSPQIFSHTIKKLNNTKTGKLQQKNNECQTCQNSAVLLILPNMVVSISVLFVTVFVMTLKIWIKQCATTMC